MGRGVLLFLGFVLKRMILSARQTGKGVLEILVQWEISDPRLMIPEVINNKGNEGRAEARPSRAHMRSQKAAPLLAPPQILYNIRN